ncbi:hypothetical protein H1R20_g4346, partial [Candolleomyces eurysporus]
MARRSSIMIDIDVTSLPSSRSDTPVGQRSLGLGKIEEESDLIARKAGLGSLMKSAKQNINVPEFDMNAFF